MTGSPSCLKRQGFSITKRPESLAIGNFASCQLKSQASVGRVVNKMYWDLIVGPVAQSV